MALRSSSCRHCWILVAAVCLSAAVAAPRSPRKWTGQVIWGDPEACASSKFFRFHTCCHGSGVFPDGDVTRSLCFPAPLVPNDCCTVTAHKRGAPRPGARAVRLNFTGSLRRHPVLTGCLSSYWLELLLLFRHSRGCLTCFGTDPLNEVLLQGFAGLKPSCRIGRVLMAFSSVVAHAMHRQLSAARAVAEQLLREEPWAWGLAERPAALPTESFFEVSGRTPLELLYIMEQLTGGFAQPLLEPWPPAASGQVALVYDFGAQHGADTMFYAARMRASVVTVDADATNLRIIEKHLVNAAASGHFDHLEAVQADFVHAMVGPLPAGGAAKPSTPYLQCAEIAGMSSLAKKIAPENTYWKVDLDGLDAACMRSLLAGGFAAAGRLPRWLSVEYLVRDTCPDAAACDADTLSKRGEQVVLLQLLWALGYRRFKVVGQRIYNVLATAHDRDRWKAEDAEEFYRRFSSGLFGDQAVDHVSGERWRSFEEVYLDLVYLDAEARAGVFPDWYDLHAELGTLPPATDS